MACVVALVFALLLFVSCHVYAASNPAPSGSLGDGQVPVVVGTQYSLTFHGHSAGPGGAGAVCSSIAGQEPVTDQLWQGQQYHQQPQGGTYVSNGSQICLIFIPYLPNENTSGDGAANKVLYTLTEAPSTEDMCDANLSTVATNGAGQHFCQCTTGHSTGGVCTSPASTTPKTDAQCKAQFGQSSGDAVTKFDWKGGTTACYGGCVSTPSSMYGSGSSQWATGPWTTVGASCDGKGAGGNGQATTGQPTPPGVDADPAATACVAPTACAGSVNGTTVCVACTSTSSNQTTVKSSTSPDGQTTTDGDVTTKQTTDNGDGTVTTTTKTTHQDGSVDTRQVTGPKTGAGSSSSAASGVAPGSGFCDQNPTVSICQKTTFGGSCSSTFTCNGDAVQCAIGQEQHQRDCMLFQPETQGGTLGADAGVGNQARTDGDVPNWSPSHPSNAITTNLSWQSQIDQTNPIASACPQDRGIQVFGNTSVTLPFSQECGSLQLLGKLLVGLTGLACLFIVFGGN